MKDTLPQDQFAHATREEIMSALFLNMVIQQTNMALMFLGKVPHPETGQTIKDIDTAKMFIDQLEMLELKTKGNLDKREQDLLKQSLTTLRLDFVQAIETQTPPQPQTTPSTPKQPQPPPAEPQKIFEPQPPSEEESRKKFSKKYE